MPAITLKGKKLPAKAEKVLKEVLKSAGLTSAEVSSVSRDAGEQALVMYRNVSARGVETEKKLYGRSGDKVLDVYEANKDKSKAAVVGLMKKKITQLGPANVSKHCSNTHYVWDVRPSSIKDKKKFVEAAEKHKSVTRLLKPPADPAYHFEIKK